MKSIIFKANGTRLGAAEMGVSSRLKQLRLEKGLTLAQLASAVGFSTAFLSRVENHKMSIPIVSLEKLAAALGVSISSFFEDESDRILISLCRKGEGRKARLRGPRGSIFEILVQAKKGKLMEPFIFNVPIGTASTPKPHSGEEFNYIVEGECELIYGQAIIRMRTGDSVYYDASVPHTSRALGGVPCRMLVVVVSREYLFHGDLSRLLNEKGH